MKRVYTAKNTVLSSCASTLLQMLSTTFRPKEMHHFIQSNGAFYSWMYHKSQITDPKMSPVLSIKKCLLGTYVRKIWRFQVNFKSIHSPYAPYYSALHRAMLKNRYGNILQYLSFYINLQLQKFIFGVKFFKKGCDLQPPLFCRCCSTAVCFESPGAISGRAKAWRSMANSDTANKIRLYTVTFLLALCLQFHWNIWNIEKYISRLYNHIVTHVSWCWSYREVLVPSITVKSSTKIMFWASGIQMHKKQKHIKSNGLLKMFCPVVSFCRE